MTKAIDLATKLFGRVSKGQEIDRLHSNSMSVIHLAMNVTFYARTKRI